MYEFIPSELKALRNWVCWKAEPDPKSHSGISKKPVNPRTGGLAMSNNPDTWSDFDTAVEVSADFAGIGFMFDQSGYFGVDLDDMDEALSDFLNGGSDNIVSEFVYSLRSYTELSQSKKGVHIICRGKLPAGRRRAANELGGFEMYDSGRFFVMTGDYCSEFIDIADGTEAIKPLHAKYLGESRTAAPATAAVVQNTAVSMDVQSIVMRAKKSANGEKFGRLYAGDISDYSSQSEADMAFCNMLAFWCSGDIDKMDAIFRSSGLMREKWDRRQSGSTYGKLTLHKAAEQCANFYSVPSRALQDDFTISIGAEKAAERTSGKLYTFDDTGNAERLHDAYGDILRYCYIDKKWLYYAGGKWHYDNIGFHRKIADASVALMLKEREICRELDRKDPEAEMEKKFLKHCNKSRSFSSKTNMLREAEHYSPLLPSMLDKHKGYLNCKSGIINLKTGELLPHSKEEYMTKIAPCEYLENSSDIPQWKAFLESIFDGDRELIRYIQKAVGYSLSGSTTEQCAFFLYGTGRNGKSTFLEIIRSIMGNYAANIRPQTIMVKPSSGSGANSDIARLKGARLVTSVEPNEGMRLDEGLLKQLTGNDVVTARKLFGDEFEFKPEFKLWMATNHKPVIRGTDTGIWRRIHLIPFTVQIPEEKVDRHLKFKLAKELNGIFKWAVDGFKLWQTEGLRMPKAILDAVREYRQEMDVISAFVDACCIAGQGEVKASILYAVYVKWAADNNEYCMSNTKFGAEMAKRFDKVKTMNGIFYRNLSLADDLKYSISVG